MSEMMGAVNVDVSQDGDDIVIRVNCKKEFGASKSGKSTTIASTLGNKVFATSGGDQVTIGLNVYKPRSSR